MSTDLLIYLIGVAFTCGTIYYRITALEKKVDKHNNVIERTYSLEREVQELKNKIGGGSNE